MAKVKWLVTAKYCVKILNILGLCPEQKNNYGFNVYTSIGILVFITIFIDILCQTINIIFILDDLKRLASTINSLPEKYTIIAKAYQLVFYAKQFRLILQEIDSEKFQPANKKQTFLANNCLKSFKIIFIVFASSVISTVFLCIAYPISDHSEERRFFAQAWVPFDSKISPFYEITYIYQSISLYIIGAIIIGVDLFICFQHMFIGCQIDMLYNKLKHSTENDLILCIKQHCYILSFVKNCNTFWNFIYFQHLFAASLVLGINLFELSTLSVLAGEFYAVLIFEIGVTLELFIYCWFGNDVKIKSNKLLYAAFETNWTEWSLKNKKTLLFFMINVSKPLEISTFNLFYLSVNTFWKIVKTGWSLFTIVNQISQPS